jgi:putative two-component system response regulator
LLAATVSYVQYAGEGKLQKSKRPLVLVADDHKLTRELLTAYLSAAGCDTVEAKNGREALEKLTECSPDLVLLDIIMPEIDGYEVCRMIKGNLKTTLLPVIVVTGLEDFDTRLKMLEIGADDYISKPINERELLTRVRNHLRIKRLTDQLEGAESIIMLLVRVLEAKDPYTRGHSERVAEYSHRIAREMGFDEDRLLVLRRAALLHDVGKIGLEDAIIRSSEKLTGEEMKKVHNHPSIGTEIISSLSSLEDAMGPIRSHHERFDGTGYPEKLARDNIPIEARIIAVADTFDALTTNRPYRKALGTQQALEEMKRSVVSGQLDPELVERFIELMSHAATARAKKA